MNRIALYILTYVAASSSFADDYVNGYIRRDGAYVQPHYRSESNDYRYDNYSSQGNSNPYTGRQGYERNEFSAPSAYNLGSNPYTSHSQGYRSPYGR